jgi:hypothetical protein
MSYLLDDIAQMQDWDLFVTAWNQQRMAHAVAFEIPEEAMEDFLQILQNFFSGKELTLSPPLVSPDIHVIGDPQGPPGIDCCRKLAGELSLFPRSLGYKIGVVCHGEALSLAGANSLLKITEEPPEYSFLVFLHSLRPLLPTLESRVWSLSLKKKNVKKPLSCMEKRGQASLQMEKHLLERLCEKGLLTQPLFEDMLRLITKEDYSFGELFDHIW